MSVTITSPEMRHTRPVLPPTGRIPPGASRWATGSGRERSADRHAVSPPSRCNVRRSGGWVHSSADHCRIASRPTTVPSRIGLRRIGRSRPRADTHRNGPSSAPRSEHRPMEPSTTRASSGDPALQRLQCGWPPARTRHGIPPERFIQISGNASGRSRGGIQENTTERRRNRPIGHRSRITGRARPTVSAPRWPGYNSAATTCPGPRSRVVRVAPRATWSATRGDRWLQRSEES